MSPALAGPVLVVGTGLIGTSVGLALRRAGVEVLLEDVDADQVGVAASMGAGRPLVDADDPAIVLVAVPPRHAAEVLAAASARFPRATLTDVTSVKAKVMSDAVVAGADAARLVGGHPMAGREVSGAAGARVDLVDDRLWILTPETTTAPEHLGQVHRLVTACGAYAVEMSPVEHDRAVALVSHAPQMLSSVLAAQLVDASDEYVRVAGQGLRDMTRIAGSDSALWTDILTVNAGRVAEVLEGVLANLQNAVEALRAVDQGDEAEAEAIARELMQGARGRARIPGKHGAQASEYAEVAVMLADRPGELGRLFSAVGETSINLEDLRIEHVLGRPSGLVEMEVRPEVSATLVDALRTRGFDVRG